ncbi:verify [Trypanosoma cruzi cruzi]|nr:verify [Trypanosoma cruzi cruzi]
MAARSMDHTQWLAKLLLFFFDRISFAVWCVTVY